MEHVNIRVHNVITNNHMFFVLERHQDSLSIFHLLGPTGQIYLLSTEPVLEQLLPDFIYNDLKNKIQDYIDLQMLP